MSKAAENVVALMMGLFVTALTILVATAAPICLPIVVCQVWKGLHLQRGPR